jgi:hypothetical protein
MIEREPEQEQETLAGSDASRRNALRRGLRARVVFPAEMASKIDICTNKLYADMKPRTEMEAIMLRQVAQSSVQADTGLDLLLCETEMAIEEVDNTWEDARNQQVNTLADRLGASPRRVAGALESSKQGALYCLEQWRGLQRAAASNGRWTEPERQLCFDLLGILSCLRNDTTRVPAADDVPRLLALCAGEIARLEDKLARVLEPRDSAAQDRARLGLPAVQNAAMRTLKSDLSRNRKRLMWAITTFHEMRLGVAPAVIIDPETGQPVRGSTPAGAKAEAPAAPSRPVPRTSTPDGERESAPVAADADNEPLPLPPGLSAEEQELLLIIGEAVRRQFRMEAEAKAGESPPVT